MKNLTGGFGSPNMIGVFDRCNGLFSWDPNNLGMVASSGAGRTTNALAFNTNVQMNEYPDDIVVKNRLMRMYKRIA